MSTILKLPSRHPDVPLRDFPLTEQMAETQLQRGMYHVERGERFAIPADRVREPQVFLNRDLWRQDRQGRVFRPGARMTNRRLLFQQKLLAWARDNISEKVPYLYYMATLGHDLHVATWGDLYGRHFHRGWTNPFLPDLVDGPLDPTFETMRKTHFVAHDCDLPVCPASLGSWQSWLEMHRCIGGFVEDLGWLSGAKVTSAFVSEEIDELTSATSSEYADFDYHEVGTSSTAESNSHTALQATSGIARATGTPTDADPIYRSVATITADTSETWEEHAIFNNSTGPAMMDRNLTGGQAVVSSDQVQYTFELTKNPEA